MVGLDFSLSPDLCRGSETAEDTRPSSKSSGLFSGSRSFALYPEVTPEYAPSHVTTGRPVLLRGRTFSVHRTYRKGESWEVDRWKYIGSCVREGG